jgi:diadenylate cyclase
MPSAQFTFSAPHLTKYFVLDILAVWFVIYQLLLIVRGTRAAHILTGIITVVIVYQLAVYMNLEALRSSL